MLSVLMESWGEEEEGEDLQDCNIPPSELEASYIKQKENIKYIRSWDLRNNRPSNCSYLTSAKQKIEGNLKL